MSNFNFHFGLYALLNGAATALAAGAIFTVLWLTSKLFGTLSTPLRKLRARLIHVAKLASYVTGSRYERAVTRWGILLAWIVVCAAITALGSSYVVLLVLLLGLLFVAFIVRHWTWDEDEKDQQIEVGTKLSEPSGQRVSVKHIDVNVDLTAEVIVSCLFLFLLAGMGFARLDQSFDVLRESAVWSVLKSVRAALYVIAEVPEASPITDSMSVWRSGNLTGVHYDTVLLRWATFGLRVTYELFLVVAILRFLDFARRKMAQSDLGEIEADLGSADIEERYKGIVRAGRLAMKNNNNALKLLLMVASERVSGGRHRYVTQDRLASAKMLLGVGARRGRLDALLAAVEGYRGALEDYPSDLYPMDWARTQNNLGNALSALGELEPGTMRLEEAVTAYREALKEYTHRRFPLDWAMVQANLGTALSKLGIRDPGTACLEQAVVASREALKEYTREREPLSWAQVNSDLGITLSALGERESSTPRLEEAATAYREALKEYTRERDPLNWARTKGLLGNVLSVRGELESSTASLEEAVTAYREALKEETRDRVPLSWATTQNNLGAALTVLGERESGTMRLDEAVAAYREALKERTRGRVPLYWAATQNNLGNALSTLGERESGTARLEESAVAYREALKEYTRERVPLSWALIQGNLGSVLSTLGERESGTTRLEESAATFSEALKECTRERAPLQWAMIQSNLGTVLSTLGKREPGTARLAESVVAFSQAFEVHTRERAPLQWALDRFAFGDTLSALGPRLGGEKGVACLQKAIVAFEDARRLLRDANMEYYQGASVKSLQQAINDAKALLSKIVAAPPVL